MSGAVVPSRGERQLTMATLMFFVAFLFAGVLLFNDYGMSWDEIPTREFGIMNVTHSVPDLRTLDSVRAVGGPAYERFGPFYEILLVQGERFLNLPDVRSVFLLRHFATFLIFFAGVVLFHRLCRRRFGQGISLIATICLATIPQLFSHAFYNVKDIAFLSTFVASMLTLDLLLERPAWRTTLLHTVATAVLMGTRVIGLFAMILTGAAALARRPTWRTLGLLIGYGVVVALLLPVVWPVLRIDPFGIVKDAVFGATTNPYTRTNLFRGHELAATALPRDYVPTWILITTPYVLTLLFLAGSARVATNCLKHPRGCLSPDRLRDLIVFSWFFLPVLGCVVLRPIMYDAWRHLFFVYPAMVYLAAVGMETIVAWLNQRVQPERRNAMIAGLAAAFFIGLAPSYAFMIRSHPYEHLYFNRLAGRDMQEIKQRYELDYWGLSYREALEYIVRTDTSSVIRIMAANYPGRVNALMLPARDRSRLRFVNSEADADYFITDYRFHPQPYPFPHEVFSVKVGDASVASVFLLRSGR